MLVNKLWNAGFKFYSSLMNDFTSNNGIFAPIISYDSPASGTVNLP